MVLAVLKQSNKQSEPSIARGNEAKQKVMASLRLPALPLLKGSCYRSDEPLHLICKCQTPL